MKIKFIHLDNIGGKYSSEKYIQKNFPDEYKYIKNFISLYNIETSKFKEKVYLAHHNITTQPKCKTCKIGEVKFLNYKNGFTTYCSLSCTASDTDIQQKRQDTNLKKYGVTHAWNNAKQKKTILEKYGVENVSQLNSIKEKKKNTTFKNHGVEHPSQSNNVKHKIKQTNNKKYGVDYYVQSEEFKTKYKESNIKNHNGIYAAQNLDAILKRTNTILDLYGVDNYSKSNEYKLKIRNNWNTFWMNKIVAEFPNYTFVSFKHNIESISLKCDHGHNFDINSNLYNLRKLKNQTICTKCNPLRSNNSYFQDQVSEYIESLNISVIKNDRVIIKPKELDILIGNIAIECNGVYWHSELFKNKTYHYQKIELTKNKNIKLIQIWEDDWNLKNDIIKSRLKNQLNLSNIKIYARNTIVKNISHKEYKLFVETNHLQGSINAKHKIGLFYNDELVSVMSFGKLRKSLGGKNEKNVYELYRFCNKLNTSVVGAASKMFKNFINNINPTKVITYADLDWGKGEFYSNLGFKFEYDTVPNYWYLINGVRMHRFNFRKQQLIKEGFDQTKTEFEIMRDRGISKIWGSGNAKWSWNK